MLWIGYQEDCLPIFHSCPNSPSTPFWILGFAGWCSICAASSMMRAVYPGSFVTLVVGRVFFSLKPPTSLVNFFQAFALRGYSIGLISKENSSKYDSQKQPFRLIHNMAAPQSLSTATGPGQVLRKENI